MAQKQFMTQEGYNTLLKRLEELKQAQNENIIALQEARAQGDLSENADYDAAREEQSRIEARIAEITEILKNVKIITKDSSNRVTTGKNVTIEFIGMNKTESYDIVGTIEADPFEHKISNESPLGKAIMGHDKGTTLTVVTEKGKEFRVKIIDVK